MAFSQAQQFFINQLRSFITMRYQNAAGSSFELPAKLGDEELWEDLRLGINYFNSTPPNITTFSFRDLFEKSAQAIQQGDDPLAPESEAPLSVLISHVMLCATFFTGLRLQWFEAGKHFQFNDNGITIVRDKQPKYQAISTQVFQTMQQLPAIKQAISFRLFRPKGMFSSSISMPRSLTRGLRGTRLGSNM